MEPGDESPLHAWEQEASAKRQGCPSRSGIRGELQAERRNRTGGGGRADEAAIRGEAPACPDPDTGMPWKAVAPDAGKAAQGATHAAGQGWTRRSQPATPDRRRQMEGRIPHLPGRPQDKETGVRQRLPERGPGSDAAEETAGAMSRQRMKGAFLPSDGTGWTFTPPVLKRRALFHKSPALPFVPANAGVPGESGTPFRP